jgi:broad specificity phosphatase PhoE
LDLKEVRLVDRDVIGFAAGCKARGVNIANCPAYIQKRVESEVHETANKCYHTIHKERPDWQLFRDGRPGGESPNEVSTRADRAMKRARAVKGDLLLFSSAHFLRVLAARWLGLDPAFGRYFVLSTASVSALGYQHNLSEPVIRLWDDTRHVGR